MPQPLPLIDQIFGKLTIRFGRDFLGRWEGLDIALVKDDWAEELNGLSTASILHALEHLPRERPPTVDQFRDLCCNAPTPAPKALPAPKADPERVAAAIERLRVHQNNHPKAWAHALKAREEAGDRLTKAQRDMWREALNATEEIE